MFRNFLGFIVLCCFLASCSQKYSSRVQKFDSLAEKSGFKKEYVKGGDFWVTTYQLIRDPKKPYVFYIEGDGVISQHISGDYRIPSPNPTPSNVMVLTLATMDDRNDIPNVVYVAQPCQFTPPSINPNCSSEYWTIKRTSPEVVNSLNSVISKIANGQEINLVGYSGGGGLAALIAVNNKDVTTIVTLAANLDRAAFNNYHKSQPDEAYSLNPLDYAHKIKNIPQMHYSGGKDEVVPSFIIDNFVSASHSPCVKQRVVVNASHNNDEWILSWPEILSDPPSLLCKY